MKTLCVILMVGQEKGGRFLFKLVNERSEGTEIPTTVPTFLQRMYMFLKVLLIIMFH